MSRLILRIGLGLALTFAAAAAGLSLAERAASAQGCTVLGGSISESDGTTTVTTVSFCGDGSLMVYTLTMRINADGSYSMSGRAEYYQLLDIMPMI